MYDVCYYVYLSILCLQFLLTGVRENKNHEGEKYVFSLQIARYGNSLCGAYAVEPMASSGRSACSVTGDGGAQNSCF